jgi:hypothetical protein
MSTAAKPLFRPEALRPKLSVFTVPPAAAAARIKLAHWAKLLGAKQAEAMKETELLGDFITEIFGQLLGYTGPAGATERYTLKREATVQVDGKFADAALGRFSTGGDGPEVIAAVEGKGPRDPLDRPFAGRKLSAVDQALRYAVNLVCDWYLVTNLHEIRLYHKGRDQFTFERFETATLAVDDEGARNIATPIVRWLIELADKQNNERAAFLDWLRVEYAVDKPSQKLQDVSALTPDALVDEVKKARGKKNPLTVAGLKARREEHGRSIIPLQTLAAEARTLERQVADLVNAAYGLTPEEVALMWKTAPPRMPGEPPAAG